jgi:hypothetical protein
MIHPGTPMDIGEDARRYFGTRTRSSSLQAAARTVDVSDLIRTMRRK